MISVHADEHVADPIDASAAIGSVSKSGQSANTIIELLDRHDGRDWASGLRGTAESPSTRR